MRSDQKTLEEIGQHFGFTRERARQIEAKALRQMRHPSRGWNPENIWNSKIRDVLDRSVVPVDIEYLASIDDAFKHSSGEDNLLKYIITNCLKNEFCFLWLDGKHYISRARQEVLEEAQKAVSMLMQNSEGKLLSLIEDEAKHLIPPELREYCGKIINDALFHSVISGDGNQKYLSAYGSRRSGLTIARDLISSSATPLSNSEIEKILAEKHPDIEIRNVLNRMQEVEGVFPLRHGVWAAIRHLDFSDEELIRLKAEIQRAVDSINKDQFHSQEVLEILNAAGSSFCSRLDGFKLAGLIRNCCVEVYLGRSMFSKTGQRQQRINLRDIIIQVLQSAGRPLKTNEIKEQVQKVRGHEGHFQVYPKDPVVGLGSGYFALNNWKSRIVENKIFYTSDESNIEKFIEIKGTKGRSFWTKDRLKRLVALRERGLTHRQIAENFDVQPHQISVKFSQIRAGKYDELLEVENAQSPDGIHRPIDDAESKRTKTKSMASSANQINVRQILTLHRANYSANMIAKIVKLREEEVTKIIDPSTD